MKPTGAEKRRIFLGSATDNFHVFSITQNNKGDIYFSSPKFGNIEWRVPTFNANQQIELLSYQAADEEKLSLHASGVTHLPLEPSRPGEFRIPGNVLSDVEGSTLGVRHLLTIFMSEPTHKPDSPALARKSDELIATKQWHPYVLILWAVPAVGASRIEVNCTFHEDDLEEIPPNSGYGAFHMRKHVIVWFAYRTKNMDRWPAKSQACYTDGHTVPLFIGTDTGQFRLEYRLPTYSIVDNNFTISMYGDRGHSQP